MSTDTHCTIRLNQYTLYHLAGVYQEANYAHQKRDPDPAALEAIDAFGEKLLAAIDQHPRARPRDIVQTTFSIFEPGIELRMKKSTVVRFLNACENLHCPEAILTNRPFLDMIDTARNWCPEHDIDNPRN